MGALLLLLVCKGIAYGVSLSGFRGGRTFPAMFLGAVGGVALSHLPSLPLVYGVAMGIGAMTVVMLRLPLTSRPGSPHPRSRNAASGPRDAGPGRLSSGADG